MDLKNLLDVKSREELRKWLEKNHKTEPECWVVVKRGRPKNDGTFWYIDAVEEAMCFGWIDSTTKTISEGVTAQKLAPRKPKSLWSELNKERCRRMERLGLMTDAGRAVLPDMTDAGFVIDDEILKALKSDPIVWENFNKFPVLYQRVRIDTIQIKKKQPELFASRLEKFILNTKEGIMFGEWNDNGRLLYDGNENRMENKMSKIKIGSHVKMSGKEMFLASVKEAESYGANVLMLYTGAPQNTKRKEIKELNITSGWEYARKCGIKEIIVHAPYIINLANKIKPETFELGVSFLHKEIKRTAALHSKILVLHPGSHLGEGMEAGIAQIVKGLNLVLNDNEDDVCIALETMAGKGSELGATFEELKMIYDGVSKKNRLRICFDTCHVNDAGYDLVGDYEGVLQEFDKLIGINQIAVIHINDSLNSCGSHKDRHANIGSGYIGMDTLKKVVHDERFIDIPKILETPWLSEGESNKKTIPPYKEEIDRLLHI